MIAITWECAIRRGNLTYFGNLSTLTVFAQQDAMRAGLEDLLVVASTCNTWCRWCHIVRLCVAEGNHRADAFLLAARLQAHV
jgi:hypothetical protein